MKEEDKTFLYYYLDDSIAECRGTLRYYHEQSRLWEEKLDRLLKIRDEIKEK